MTRLRTTTCEFREMLDRVGDKWSLFVIAILEQRLPTQNHDSCTQLGLGHHDPPLSFSSSLSTVSSSTFTARSRAGSSVAMAGAAMGAAAALLIRPANRHRTCTVQTLPRRMSRANAMRWPSGDHDG
jgi:hypothetical protein